jgi:hypothetical protein
MIGAVNGVHFELLGSHRPMPQHLVIPAEKLSASFLTLEPTDLLFWHATSGADTSVSQLDTSVSGRIGEPYILRPSNADIGHLT